MESRCRKGREKKITKLIITRKKKFYLKEPQKQKKEKINNKEADRLQTLETTEAQNIIFVVIRTTSSF